ELGRAHVALLRRFIRKGLEHGVAIRLTQAEELVREHLRLLFAHEVLQLFAVADELLLAPRQHGHPGDECNLRHDPAPLRCTLQRRWSKRRPTIAAAMLVFWMSMAPPAIPQPQASRRRRSIGYSRE